MELETLTLEDKLKLACYSEVSKICKHVCEHNTLLGELDIDKQSKMLIAEFLWKKLKVYAEDLELFAKHAKRSTINIEDVKLLVRRNTSLVDHVSKMSEELSSIKESKKKKIVKGNAGVMEVE